MHLAYRMYTACSSLHFILSVVLLLAGFFGSFHFLTIEPVSMLEQHNTLHLENGPGLSIFSLDAWKNQENTSDPVMYWGVRVRGCTLAGPYFIACVSSTLFSMIFLSLNTSSNHASEGKMATMMASFYYHQVEQDENHDLTDVDGWSNMIVISEIIYWSFLVSYSYVAIAANTLNMGSVELFYLRLLTHLFCIHTICSPTGKRKRVDITSSIAFVAFIAETLLVISMAYTQINIVLAYFHRFLDLLLILGHRWDSNPTWEVILNCRLFFVAVGGGLLHADILISSSPPP